MNASHICRGIYQWIQEKERNGEVHSIFKNTINILSEDGRFIPIIVKDKPMSPNSIKLVKVIDFNDLNIAIGEKVIFSKTLLFGENINVFYGKSILWDSGIKLVSNTDTFENFQCKLNIVKEFILNKGNKDGIYSLMKFVPGGLFVSQNKKIEDKSQLFIKDRFIKFINSFKSYDINSINILSKKIIGFGPGLTPSMDDFLSGMMIANIYISYFLGFNLENAYSLNNQIVKDIENRTTLVSEEMLKLSSLGEANEDIRDLMIALISTTTNKEEFNDLLIRVVSFGHSSGTDILCGIYIGSYILMNKYKKSNNIYPRLSFKG